MIALGFITALMLACSGWIALSLAMDRHYADVHGRGKEPDAGTRRLFRIAGSFALLAVFAISVVLEGWTIGPVLCLGTMTAGALLLVLLLSYAPHRVTVGGKLAATSSILFGLTWLIAR
jgi:hypothetical protein